MQGIEVYLQKFAAFGLKERALSENIRKAALEICGVELLEKEVRIEDGVLRVLVSGPAKAELFLHRRAIEDRFSEISRVL